MADVRIEWNDTVTDEYLAMVEDDIIGALATEVHAMAEGIAPVRVRRTPVPRWAKRGYVGVPGKLKASTVQWDGSDADGRYWRIGALWYGRFLDPKARQLHRLFPFLVTALRSTVDGRTFRVG
jgi:hypothetical protein